MSDIYLPQFIRYVYGDDDEFIAKSVFNMDEQERFAASLVGFKSGLISSQTLIQQALTQAQAAAASAAQQAQAASQQAAIAAQKAEAAAASAAAAQAAGNAVAEAKAIADQAKLTVGQAATTLANALELQKLITAQLKGVDVAASAAQAAQAGAIAAQGAAANYVVEVKRLLNSVMTRAALTALKDANNLVPGAIYVISENFGTLGAVDILLRAVAVNKISRRADFKTTFAVDAWPGEYDLAANSIEWLTDNKKNKVVAHRSVITFPWGNNVVNDVFIADELSTLNYTGGELKSIVLRGESTLTMMGGSLRDTVIKNSATVTHRYTNSYRNAIDKSTVDQVGTGYLRDCIITQNSSVIIGNVDFENATIKKTPVYTSGSVGRIAGVTFDNAYTVNLQNIQQVDIWNVSVTDYGYINNNAAKSVFLNRSVISGNAYTDVNPNCSLDAFMVHIDTGAYLHSTGGGKLLVNCSKASAGSRLFNAASATDNGITGCVLDASAAIGFAGSTTRSIIYYSRASTSSSIIITDSPSSKVYQSESSALGTITINKSNAAEILYSTAASQSVIDVVNNSESVVIHSSVAIGHSAVVRAENNSAAGKILGAHCSSVGQLFVRNSTGSNWNVNYSSFTAYCVVEHKFIANNITVAMLHGYGYASISNTWSTAGQVIFGTSTRNF